MRSIHAIQALAPALVALVTAQVTAGAAGGATGWPVSDGEARSELVDGAAFRPGSARTGAGLAERRSSVRGACDPPIAATRARDSALRAGCAPSWLPTFGEFPGCGSVYAMTRFDDGSGEALYVGGNIAVAGGALVDGIARWNGTSWTRVGSGANPPAYDLIFALSKYDDGAGTALYAGGSFTLIDGTSANHVAKWNGASWSALGLGIDADVFALAEFDDGTGGGPALYAGGTFTSAGGVTASRIAKWNGSTWSALGGGVDGPGVRALAVHDDGSGPALFVGGTFTLAGGVSAHNIAKWDGTTWSALGTGLSSDALDLAVFDDGSGSGPALYAGGSFSSAGGVPANRIAKWNGSSWSSLGTGLSGSPGWVSTLTVHDDGTGGGPALYVGGAFTTAGGASANRVAKWNGASWSPLGSGVQDSVSADPNHVPRVDALASFDDGAGSGSVLYAGGEFGLADDAAAVNIARWDVPSWSALGNGMNSSTHAVAVHDDELGGGPALYAGGQFTHAGGVRVNGVAKRSGTTWSPLGTGIEGWIQALSSFDPGMGSRAALYAGGNIQAAGGLAVSFIAQWDGTAWSGVGSGTNDWVNALVVHDDGSGSGSKLYAGGRFTSAGGAGANHVASWNGNSWSTLGSGTNDWVEALGVFDDGAGGGPALFATGRFTSAGGAGANRIAKWNGTGWSPLGLGLNAGGASLAVFDDGSGSGPALYVGGSFSSAGGVSASHVARWDGTNWTPLGNGVDGAVRALAVYDDGTGSGPALYAAGSFTSAGGASAMRIAKWDGSGWSSLGDGMIGTVRALLAFDDGSGGGAALYAVGQFAHSPAGDSFIAKWGGCGSPAGQAYCFGDGSGTPCPCGNSGGAGRGCANSAFLDGAFLSTTGSASVSADDLALSVAGSRPGQPGLFFQGNNAVGGGLGAPFGDGLRCAGGSVRRLQIVFANGSGVASSTIPIASTAGVSPGETKRYQWWYRDPGASPCGSGFNLSNGVAIHWGS